MSSEYLVGCRSVGWIDYLLDEFIVMLLVGLHCWFNLSRTWPSWRHPFDPLRGRVFTKSNFSRSTRIGAQYTYEFWVWAHSFFVCATIYPSHNNEVFWSSMMHQQCDDSHLLAVKSQRARMTHAFANGWAGRSSLRYIILSMKGNPAENWCCNLTFCSNWAAFGSTSLSIVEN